MQWSRLYKFILVLFLALTAPQAMARLMSCNLGPEQPKPDWVEKTPYQSGYEFAVGTAEKEGRGLSELLRAAELNAKGSLARGISVKIKAENAQSTRVNSGNVQQDVVSKITEIAEEELRGIKQRGYWVDQESCNMYVLVYISNAEIAQAKKEKSARQRLERVKQLLADGSDRNRLRDIKVRLQYLQEAESILPDIDFTLLPNEAKRDVFAKRIAEAMEQTKGDASRVSERMALVAMNHEGIKDGVINKLMDALRAGDNTADRLMADCKTEDECKSIASDRGFSKLALIKVKSNIGTSQMGAMKGTLTITRTILDIRMDKILKEDNASAQVIGWSNEELDWNAAVDKAVQGLK